MTIRFKLSKCLHLHRS